MKFLVPLETEGPLTRELHRVPGNFGLGQVPLKQSPDSVTSTICGYCSTGCSLDVHLQEGAAVNLTPSREYPVNRGMACPKGWEALTVLTSNERATVPMLRNEQRQMEPVNWETALTTFVSRFKKIQKVHGNESVAFLSTGQIPTEEMAMLGALTKFGMGIVHGDGNTRQCMASSVVAYKQSFGFDAPPYTFQDFEESDVIILVGSNLCIAHPILWERVMRNRHRPKIIVVDPRCTETAMQATKHLAIRPKADLVLFYGLAKILIENGWIDRDYVEAHTNGFQEFADHVRPFDAQMVSERTGIAVDVLHAVARTIYEGQRVSFWWTMGVNQSYEGVRTAQSLINLALMTGNMGRPGTGANSITGQCNAMGSRLFSNTTNLFGGRDFTNAAHRDEVARLLEIDVQSIPEKNSWAYHEIIEGILRGKIKGLWVIATNPAHSWINQNQVLDILGRLDFLVVQDMYQTTETALLADLVLPAAGWGEKDGTFINSERRMSVVKKVAKAPGKALSDFSIFKLIGRFWGCGRWLEKWESPEAVFQMLAKLSAGQPCDFSGVDGYRMLEEAAGIQWPYPKNDPPTGSQRRLFEDGRYYHSDHRARFVFENAREMPEQPSEKFPMILLTGRGSASQWHTQTRTEKSAVLRKLAPREIYVVMSPVDARRLGVQASQWVMVESQRGRIRARVFVSHTVQPGHLFIPMHYKTTNKLTDAVFDPYSKQPSYKACAVRIVRAGPNAVQF